ncbi:MAG: hypothetical protein U9N14_05565, partial [Pseudomonadota bacterium]|nr:hypothetical protein [Pseudomonadota bacterium]
MNLWSPFKAVGSMINKGFDKGVDLVKEILGDKDVKVQFETKQKPQTVEPVLAGAAGTRGSPQWQTFAVVGAAALLL